MLKMAHQAMLIMANDGDGYLCRPSAIAARGGSEDVSLNTTANVHSAMIAQNYYNPDVLISLRERSPHVRMMHWDEYDYDAYDPTINRFWDDGFEADLHGRSHVSFAHMLMFGERSNRHWRSAAGSEVPLFGHRGPAEGRADIASYATDEHGQWSGTVVRADNSIVNRRDMKPWLHVGEGQRQRPDHIFVLDDGMEGVDVLLTFTASVAADHATFQHD